MRRRTLIAAAVTATLAKELVMTETSAAQPKLDPENTVYLDLKSGRVVIQLRPDLAPKHVERVKTLAREGFYDGTPFHRVIEGFMAQGGDPTGTGTGGSKLPEPARRIHHQAALPARHRAAWPAPATRTAPTASSSSCSRRRRILDGQYTIWGQVVQGMEFVDQIKRGSGSGGTVQNPGPDRDTCASRPT